MLKQFTKNYYKAFSLLLCAILCVAFGFAQQTTRNGVVKDASTGSGIVGATVAVKGTSNSTQTDATGSFSISASIGQTLVFSFIGYDPKEDRKSTRLNSSHVKISYAVFCLKKKKKRHN